MRRRVLDLLADSEQTAGAVTGVIRAESALSQPAASQHLRVLRESGFASVRAEGARRFHAVDPSPLSEVDVRSDRFRGLWDQRLDAPGTEPARGSRASRTSGVGKADPTGERNMT